MSDNEKQRPIIVVKKKGKHGGHHGGAWKVAYADFVTAMMAFFLVMWLVNQSDAVKKAVEGYFNDPVGFMKNAGKGVMQGGTAPIKDLKDQKQDIAKKIEEEQKRLSEAGKKIKKTIRESSEIAKLKDFVEVEMTPEGLRIQLIDASDNSDSSIFFDLGSAKLKPKTALLLSAIAGELGKLPNHIMIEGHTDARPMASSSYTNWELSADRANSARRQMEISGLQSNQVVEIRGDADVNLRIPTAPEDPRNRRVAIIVLDEAHDPKFKEIEVGSENASLN
jgi:chemotaxis protein MotB